MSAYHRYGNACCCQDNAHMKSFFHAIKSEWNRGRTLATRAREYSMTTVFITRTLSVSIDCPSGKVYEFVSNPENLPRWATGLCKSVRKSDGEWIVETPQGPMKFRFAQKNEFSVLDHYVSPAPGVEVYVPMRVLSNGSGSEVIFTVFRLPDMSDEKYAEDAGLVEQDLRTLKNVLEGRAARG